MVKPEDGAGGVDAVYYRDGVSNSTAMAILRRARLAMFELFMREMRPAPETSIIDIGTSDEENEGANFLEKHYPWRQNIVCAGIGNGKAVMRAYPGIAFRQIVPGAPLPFADGAFDIACSNAVLEHVGGPPERRAFILEHLRVARAVFITVPNRWFPVEHHTSIPLLHYTPRLFRWLLAGTRLDHWSDPRNMDLLDAALLVREWPGPGLPHIVKTGLSLGPFSSNLALIWRLDGA